MNQTRWVWIVVIALQLILAARCLDNLRYLHPQIEHVRWAYCISVNPADGYGTIKECEP
jgi:hypothetical protein